MSAKLKSKAASKAAPAKTKAAPAKATATAKKAGKAAPAEIVAAPAEIGEEVEADEDEGTSSAGASGGGNAAALAAATGSGEMSASFKNFRHHPDMENFYRFIYENDLRLEALAIIDEMATQRQFRKSVGKAKLQAH